LLVLGLAYLVLAKLGLALASLHPSASPVWPPSGLALAAFLLWGNRVWVAIGAGAFMANVTTFGSVPTSLVIALGNTLEGMSTAWLLSRFSGGLDTFKTPSGVAKFAGLALAPGTMVGATIGVGSLVLAGYAEASKFPSIWMTWWLGDVGGQVLVTPVIVLWAYSDLRQLDRADLQKLGMLLAGTMAVGLIAFSPLIEQTAMRGSLAFLAIAPMLWAALRYNQRDTATAALVLSVFAIWGTLANGGPFAGHSLNDSFLLVLAFAISTAVPSLVLSADVAERRLSEERYRSLVEQANDIVAMLDLDMRFSSVNPAVERLLGYSPEELVGTPLARYVPKEQLPLHKSMLDRKIGGDATTQYEMQLLGKDGQRFTLEVNSKLMFDAKGNAIGVHAIARDIGERKNAEARQTLLIRELQHRTRNMLAVIQSIVSNTLARSRDMESAKDAIVGRLHALARAQEFVSSGPAAGVSLRDLLESVLSGFATRATIQGAPLIIGGSFAQSLALVLHELATNATKYGALSTPDGRLLVAWEVTHPADGPLLTFSWSERGGPPVKMPVEEGFGSLLISQALQGAAQIAFDESGLKFTLEVPLERATRASNVNGSQADPPV
jgi:PAS domain S-box-containing protein